jgi:hypothetical protein
VDKVGDYWKFSGPVQIDNQLVLKNQGADSYAQVRVGSDELLEQLAEMSAGIPVEKWDRWARQMAGVDRSDSLAEIKDLRQDFQQISDTFSTYQPPAVPLVDSVFVGLQSMGLDRAKWYLMCLLTRSFFTADVSDLSSSGLVSATASELLSMIKRLRTGNPAGVQSQ